MWLWFTFKGLMQSFKTFQLSKFHFNKIKFYLSEYLKVRSHDPEEAIRHDVIVSIVTAAKKDILLVNDHLLNFVRERTLDKRVSRNNNY